LRRRRHLGFAGPATPLTSESASAMVREIRAFIAPPQVGRRLFIVADAHVLSARHERLQELWILPVIGELVRQRNRQVLAGRQSRDAVVPCLSTRAVAKRRELFP
jgi:hypothetical protein